MIYLILAGLFFGINMFVIEHVEDKEIRLWVSTFLLVLIILFTNLYTANV